MFYIVTLKRIIPFLGRTLLNLFEEWEQDRRIKGMNVYLLVDFDLYFENFIIDPEM
jgi:hypothetical protein